MIDIIDLFPGVEILSALPIRYWSQDESRFGLHTITRSVFTALGIKPICPIQFNYQSFYSARVTPPDIERMHTLKKGQMRRLGGPVLSTAEPFYLAAAFRSERVKLVCQKLTQHN
jgi:hypothetical protein